MLVELGRGRCRASDACIIETREFDMNNQPDVALEHYNGAARARGGEDFDGAVAELDACLCANPHPLLEVLAWYNLGEIIFLNFDFGNRHSSSISDEEYYWRCRAEECIQRSIKTYDRCLKMPISANERIVSDCHAAYEKAKALRKFFSSYGPVAYRYGEYQMRSDIVLRSISLPPIRCLADWEGRRKAAARQNR